MSKEHIVEKILLDAKLRANSFVKEQTDKADDILADAAEQCKQYIYTFKSETDKMVADIESRSKTVAELDARKLTLAAKTRLLDEVFRRAADKLASLGKDECRALLIAMLRSAAEDGDVITVGKRQRDCLNDGDVAQVAGDKGRYLRMPGVRRRPRLMRRRERNCASSCIPAILTDRGSMRSFV